jgi:hypothetical protein
MNHMGTMREHPRGEYVTVYDKDTAVSKAVMGQITLKNKVIRLEAEKKALEGTLINTTAIIDDLQENLKVNRQVRSDAHFFSQNKS